FASFATQGIHIDADSVVTPQLILFRGRSWARVCELRPRTKMTNKLRATRVFMLLFFAPPRLFLFIEFFDEPALIQLGDEARVHEFFGFAAADFWPRLRYVIIGGFQPLHDRIGHRNKILLVGVVGVFQRFPVVYL